MDEELLLIHTHTHTHLGECVCVYKDEKSTQQFQCSQSADSASVCFGLFSQTQTLPGHMFNCKPENADNKIKVFKSSVFLHLKKTNLSCYFLLQYN